MITRKIPCGRPKFVTKKGWLTPYALACGYWEVGKNSTGSNVVILKRQHGCYLVEVRPDENLPTTPVAAWEAFRSLVAARAYFSSMIRTLNAQGIE